MSILLMEKIGYVFSDSTLLTHAMRHSSQAASHKDSNERLEFLGDAILGFVVSEYLYETCPQEDEGRLTQIKSEAVSRRACAQAVVRMDLARDLVTSKAVKNRGELPQSVLAGLYEALVAAIYHDGGYDSAKQWVLASLAVELKEAAQPVVNLNPKAVLQEVVQSFLKIAPIYQTLSTKGPEHSLQFHVEVLVAEIALASGQGASKKHAHQDAAQKALQKLMLYDNSGALRSGNDLKATFSASWARIKSAAK